MEHVTLDIVSRILRHTHINNGRENEPALSNIFSYKILDMVDYLEDVAKIKTRILQKSTLFVDCHDGDLERVACPIFVTAIPRSF